MIIRDLFILVLSINWILGGLIIAYYLPLMITDSSTRDFKLLLISLLFGLFGYIVYINA